MPRRPSPGNFSDPYGWRIHPITRRRQFHDGSDIGWSMGVTLVAPSGGVIVAYGWQGGWGLRLDFLGDDGALHYLAHTNELWANVGEWVPEGTAIAEMGSTGNVQGRHLHWEVRPDGGRSTIDPEVWLAQAIAADAPAPIPTKPFYARAYARSKEKLMIALLIVDGRGLLGPAGKTRTYVAGGGIFVDTTDHAERTANDISVIVQGYDSTGQVMGTPNLTYAELYAWAKGSNALSPEDLEPYARAAGVSAG